MTDFRTIQLDADGAVAWLTFNRPKKLNTFNEPLLTEIFEALEQLRAQPEQVFGKQGVRHRP